MTDTIFIRLLDGANRPARLSDAIEKLRDGNDTSDTYSAEPNSLCQVPGSPLAYWVSDRIRRLFLEMPAIERVGRTARSGSGTMDDFRWLRSWWEYPSTDLSRRWIPIAKGGEYATYYSPLYLTVDWKDNGDYLGNWVYQNRPREGYRWGSKGINADFYPLPGISWPLRTQRGLSVRVRPRGCVFTNKSPTIVSSPDSLLPLLAIANSAAFRALVELQMAFGSYELGVIQRTPVPEFGDTQAEKLGDLALRCVHVKRGFDTANEASHAFHLPALLNTEGVALDQRLECWRGQLFDGERQLADYQREIDDTAFQLYGIEDTDRQAIEESLRGRRLKAVSENDNREETENTDEAIAVFDYGTLVAVLLSYTVGCVFGRWDARIALDPSLAPRFADPFASLPVCSPGMLVGPDSLPAKRDGIASEEWMRARKDVITPPPEGSVENPIIPDSEYPLAVDWDGILVDEPGHEYDVVGRVREVLGLVWGEHVDGIEGEACKLLGAKDLRTYFRNPRKFFDFHIKRYSKSRRKAPIYWLLQSPKRNYGLWIYYHRLDPDLLFKALTRYTDPKIRLEETRLEEYRTERRSAGDNGAEASRAERVVGKQEDLLSDVREFRERLARAANLNLTPDLNDGVVLNIAPLHELVPWKEAASKWKELLAGKYEWSSIGKQLRAKGLVS